MTVTRSWLSCPPPPFAHASLPHTTFAASGWLCVPNLLSPSELRVLQSDCSTLYAHESTESIIAKGCVVDVMSQCPIHDSDLARIDSKCYLRARANQLNCKDEDVETFAALLFEKLPTIAGQILAAFDVNDVTRSNMLFFNEHFVVKPPRSHVEFRWHRDEDEQLAMCVHLEEVLPYVSAWCALDDVTIENGALRFVPLDVSNGQRGENGEDWEGHASDPVIVKAGDVVFFLSNVWHCSSSNESDGARRAFYAQYSRKKITARPQDSAPLSFAIPCKEA